MATLHLMIGLPCSGKTTFARQLEQEHSALRRTPKGAFGTRSGKKRSSFSGYILHPEANIKKAIVFFQYSDPDKLEW